MMVSIAGSQMQLWAIFWHIRTLTPEPIALGAVGLVRILPVIIFSLIGGALADIADRRKVMFVTQSVMALEALTLTFLTLSGHITLWMIYGLTTIQAVAIAFDTPARQSLVPNLVPPRDLPNAFSMNSIANQAGAIVGPALSGLVIAYWGQAYTYLINAISFLAVLLALVLMGKVQQQIEPMEHPKISLTSIREGIRFTLGHPIIISTMLLDFFATFFSSANTLMPIFARDILHVGAIEYGYLSAAQSIGAVSAALVISQFEEIHHQGRVFLSAVVVFGFATIVFGVSRVLWLSILGLILMGAADTVSTIIRNTIRQLQTPDYIRGRMTGINMIFFMGGPQLGEVEAGAVAQLFSAPVAVITGGVGCILAVIMVIRHWPSVARYTDSEPTSSGVSPA